MGLREVHLIVGATGLVAFALQGQLMEHVIAVSTLPDGERMMYRTSHLYLMLASVINIMRGLSGAQPQNLAHWESLTQRLVSVIFLLAPLFIGASFFFESAHPEFERPMAANALFGIFGAGAVLVLIELKKRFFT